MRVAGVDDLVHKQSQATDRLHDRGQVLAQWIGGNNRARARTWHRAYGRSINAHHCIDRCHVQGFVARPKVVQSDDLSGILRIEPTLVFVIIVEY